MSSNAGDNFGPLAGYQLAETQRANSTADQWKANATQWRSYAAGLQKDLEVKTDQANGVAGVRAALVEELKKHHPESPLNDKAERTKIYRSSINASRIERGLAPLSEQEIAKI